MKLRLKYTKGVFKLVLYKYPFWKGKNYQTASFPAWIYCNEVKLNPPLMHLHHHLLLGKWVLPVCGWV